MLKNGSYDDLGAKIASKNGLSSTRRLEQLELICVYRNLNLLVVLLEVLCGQCKLLYPDVAVGLLLLSPSSVAATTHIQCEGNQCCLHTDIIILPSTPGTPVTNNTCHIGLHCRTRFYTCVCMGTQLLHALNSTCETVVTLLVTNQGITLLYTVVHGSTLVLHCRTRTYTCPTL